ncbi:hypothetical protein HFD88_001721 [Aspergillus terreus]|nr:hypothetical protein HFD88_001721 [Aspergillus terreus]
MSVLKKRESQSLSGYGAEVAAALDELENNLAAYGAHELDRLQRARHLVEQTGLRGYKKKAEIINLMRFTYQKSIDDEWLHYRTNRKLEKWYGGHSPDGENLANYVHCLPPEFPSQFSLI